MKYSDDHRRITTRRFAAVVVAADTAAAAMLVATVVSMWALSAMAVTVRHGRSRMARWAQQQHDDLHRPQPSAESALAAVTTTTVYPHDPGGGSFRTPSDDGNGQRQQHRRDKANQLLRIVESQQQLGGNCTAGTDLNMGEGVVDRYAQVFHNTSRSILQYEANVGSIKKKRKKKCIYYTSV